MIHFLRAARSGWPQTSAALVLCATLAACTATPPPAAPTESTPQTAAVPNAPAPKPEVKIDTPDPAEMIGWSEAKITSVLGAASLVRKELGSKIWQYQTPHCVLFLFLYPDGEVSKLKHLDARSKAGGDTRACVTEVLRQRLSAASQSSAPKT